MVQESHWNVGASVCFHVGDNTCMLMGYWDGGVMVVKEMLMDK